MILFPFFFSTHFMRAFHRRCPPPQANMSKRFYDDSWARRSGAYRSRPMDTADVARRRKLIDEFYNVVSELGRVDPDSLYVTDVDRMRVLPAHMDKGELERNLQFYRRALKSAKAAARRRRASSHRGRKAPARRGRRAPAHRGRKAPALPASDPRFRVGQRKRGLDRRMWVVAVRPSGRYWKRVRRP